MKTRTILRAALLATVASLSIPPALAQGKITLRFADSLPANHSFTTTLAQPFMSEVTRRTNGAIDFQHYPAEQLGKGKDLLTLLQSGVADIALVVGPYVSEQMPLSGVVELPGGFGSSCQGAKGLWQLAVGGALEGAELQPNGIRMFAAIVQPPFQVFISKPKLDSLKDLAGLKLRTTGGPMDLMARKLGAVPVRMAAPEVREAMSRGTIDGGVLALVSIGSYNLTPLVKAASLNENFGSAALMYSISEKSWQRLSPEQRQVLMDVGRKVTFEACAKIDEGVAKDYDKMRAAGISVASMGAADRAQMQTAADEVGAEWAKGLEGRGKPASAVLKAFREAVR
jgi:TRAP-type C4-dicarboxylate transport system substrate-binding protein